MDRRIKHLKRNILAETAGWIGSVCILSSYALLSVGVVSGDSILYYALSGGGALGLAIITYRHRAFQSFIVNTIFTLIAILAIIHLLLV